MKKFAIGCGVIVLLAVLAGGVGCYYVMNRIGSTVASFTALAEIPDIEEGVENQSPYTPPASGELNETQVTRLVAVQSSVRQQLGDRFEELDGRYRTLSESLEQRDANVLDAPALLGAYSDLATAYLDAKRWQVEALNEQQLSLDEYRWIRQQAYAALGVAVMNIDIGQIIEDARAGRTPDDPPAVTVTGPTGPEQNRTLVEQFRQALEDNVALAFLGL